MADVTYIPEQNQGNNILPWMLANNGGWGNGLFGGGFGSSFFGALLGSFVPGLFGGWGNGWGGGYGGAGNGAAAASLGAQATANSNTELLMNAINGTDADIRLLATTLNGDVDSIRLAVNSIQGAVAQVASQVGMSSLQVVNAIQAGNSDLASRLCQCCCEMKQLVTSQGYENQLATLNQTNALTNSIADLKAEMISQFCASEKRDMQNEINRQGDLITQLRSQIDNDRQTAQFASMLAPIANQVSVLLAKAPQTVPVIWPQLTVSQTSPATTPTTTGA